MIRNVANWWIVVVIVAAFLGVGAIGVSLLPEREEVDPEAVGAAVADTLRAILDEIGADTMALVNGTSDAAHWDRRLDRIEALLTANRRLMVLTTQRQERNLCWASDGRDIVCRDE